MKQLKRLKISLPTLRKKERYIMSKIFSQESVTYSNLEDAILNTFLDFFGEYGFSKLSLWIMKDIYNEKNQTLVVRCNNKSLSKVIAGLGLIPRLGDNRVIFKILKVSGTIKGLQLKQRNL